MCVSPQTVNRGCCICKQPQRSDRLSSPSLHHPQIKGTTMRLAGSKVMRHTCANPRASAKGWDSSKQLINGLQSRSAHGTLFRPCGHSGGATLAGDDMAAWLEQHDRYSLHADDACSVCLILTSCSITDQSRVRQLRSMLVACFCCQPVRS